MHVAVTTYINVILWITEDAYSFIMLCMYNTAPLLKRVYKIICNDYYLDSKHFSYKFIRYRHVDI